MAKGKKPKKKAAKKNANPQSRKGVGGAPSKYDPVYAEQVTKLCKLGATDKEIADFFDVEESTINNWKKAHPEFMESIKKGKIIADAEVAHSLHKRAIGYQYDEITYEKIGPGEELTEVGENGMETVKKELYKKKVVTKEVVPDVAAQNIWLKNRRGKVDKTAQRWADKHELTGEGGGPIELEVKPDLTKLSKEELRQYLALTQKVTPNDNSQGNSK
jgi:hypothetical protein